MMYFFIDSLHNIGLFPTHVGVFRTSTPPATWRSTLPHARGGVSYVKKTWSKRTLSSPRTWGCFHRDAPALRDGQLFPTHVGVFLKKWTVRPSQYALPHARGGVSGLPGTLSAYRALPHARGGVSITNHRAYPPRLSSPRTWGCFFYIVENVPGLKLFPTHVGVFLVAAIRMLRERPLPHARGGVS